VGEVAHSLHFWHMTPSSVRALAVSVGTAGRIYGSNGHWTTFVPLEEEEGLTMLAHSGGLALRWIYFQDFGLGLEFWDGGAELGRAEFHWESGQTHAVSTGLETRLAERGLSVSIQSLLELARKVADRTEPPRALRDRAASLLGLSAYEWLSPQTVIDTAIETEREQFPEAEDVELS
jgi:hypothetical protein